MARTPAIQGLSTPAPQQGYGNDRLGQSPTFIVDSSNPFYTSKLEGLKIASTTFTPATDPQNPFGGSMDVVFDGTPDLSEVMVGNYLKIYGSSDGGNETFFKITGVNDGSDTLTVLARDGITNASADGFADTLPFFGAYKIYCLSDTTGLTVEEANSAGATQSELVQGDEIYGEFKTVTVESGEVRLKLL